MRVTKALGVHIDEFLSWEKHVHTIAKKASSGIAAIRKLKSCINRGALIGAYNALIAPHSIIVVKFGTLLALDFLTACKNYKTGLLEL